MCGICLNKNTSKMYACMYYTVRKIGSNCNKMNGCTLERILINVGGGLRRSALVKRQNPSVNGNIIHSKRYHLLVSYTKPCGAKYYLLGLQLYNCCV